jgi:hypothetical protein
VSAARATASFGAATPWNRPYPIAARFPLSTREPASAGPHFSGNSLPPLESSRRAGAGAFQPARAIHPDCIPTMAANRVNESPALETNIPNQNHARRRNKLRGFMIAETVALGVLFLAGAFALSVHPVNAAVLAALNVVMLAAAVSVATIPIFFFALAPVLPRSKR